MISHTLTNVPGSSAYFRQAYIVYSNRTKQEDLGVPGHLLAQHGAVSRAVAAAMAEGVRRKAKVDFGLAVTGIAGPGGAVVQQSRWALYTLPSLPQVILSSNGIFGRVAGWKSRSAPLWPRCACCGYNRDAE